MPPEHPCGPGVPSSARVYDYLCGGRDHNDADRELGDELAAIYPGARQMVRDNRVWLGYAVMWAVSRAGIRQFLDLGSGFPVRGSVMDIALAASPQARVAAVDHDVLVARYQAKLEREGVRGAAVIRADIGDPGTVLAHEGVLEVVDLTEPVMAVLGAVLHYFPAERAREVTAGYIERLAPDSYVAITVPRFGDDGLFEQVRETCTAATLHNHTVPEIQALFGDLEIMPPGLGPVASMRPGWGDAKENPPGTAYIVGGIGRRP